MLRYEPQENISDRVRNVLGGIDESQIPDNTILSYEYKGKAIKEVINAVGETKATNADYYDDIDSAIVFLCASYFCKVMANIQPLTEKEKQSSYTLQQIDYNELETKLYSDALSVIDEINGVSGSKGYNIAIFKTTNT